MRAIWTALWISMLLCGCANFTKPTTLKTLKPTEYQWLTYDASRRGTFVTPVDSGLRICAEPAPDVGLSFVNEVSGKLSHKTGTSESGEELGAKFNATALALAGRDASVLSLREAMYRLCEARMNGTLDDPKYAELMASVLDKILQSKQEDSKTAEATARTAEASLQMLQLQMQMELKSE